ncbi:hypothetical protein [Serpentinimonas maccroryi]|uniref:hypothetical protein n=1 Tax=Serpentinimonas maccroryi TaxID=1458426 RepID=UPI002033B427|nr:hypothetical protein [Serpentinimonas maccroryi]MCM2478973.1 hypothetical protein [Serpentinimonas maccroryi]
MRTDDDRKHQRAEAAFMLRREDSLRALNQRIERLAHALQLDLKREGAIDRLIRQVKTPSPPSNAESYSGPERRARALDGTERRRKDMLFFELRGLVVLRYELVSAYASQYGSQAMMLMIESVDLHVAHIGPVAAAGAERAVSSN